MESPVSSRTDAMRILRRCLGATRLRLEIPPEDCLAMRWARGLWGRSACWKEAKTDARTANRSASTKADRMVDPTDFLRAESMVTETVRWKALSKDSVLASALGEL